MDFNNFNFNQAEVKSFSTFANGEYPVCVDGASVDDTQSPVITLKIKLRFLAGEYEGQFIYDNLLLNSDDASNFRLSIAKKRMNDFNKFLEKPLNSAEDLIDNCFMIVIKNTIKGDKTYCNISYYKKYDAQSLNIESVNTNDIEIPF